MTIKTAVLIILSIAILTNGYQNLHRVGELILLNKIKGGAAMDISQFIRATKQYPVIDFRPDVAQGIIPGSLWLDSNEPVDNWMRFFVKPNDKFVAVFQQGKAYQMKSRIQSAGFFGIQGWNRFNMSEWPYSTNKPSIMSGKEVLQIPSRTHLDVRNPSEWEQTGIIEGSILIPLPELKDRLNQIKGKPNIIVSCRTGLRARAGWSVIEQAGNQASVLDQHFSDLADIGFKIVPYTPEFI